jgi:hypothetical protein
LNVGGAVGRGTGVKVPNGLKEFVVIKLGRLKFIFSKIK